MLIQFHGGHFRTGAKSREALPLLHRLAGEGWVCISANYRLGGAGRFPNSLIDAKAVIAWVRSHAAEYGADPSLIIVAGSSAGAHLASMAALTPNNPTFQPNGEHADTTVAAAVCLYGYYGKREAASGVASSPQAYIKPGAPPFLVAHGDHDTQILIGHADRFVAELRGGSTRPVVYLQLLARRTPSTCFGRCASTRSSTGSRHSPRGCVPAALRPTTDLVRRCAQFVKRRARRVTDGQVDVRGDGCWACGSGQRGDCDAISGN